MKTVLLFLTQTGIRCSDFHYARWFVLTGSRWKRWAQLGRWSVLSPSSPLPHLHRSCMRANRRPSTALDRRRSDKWSTTNISKTNPHACFCCSPLPVGSGGSGDGGGGRRKRRRGPLFAVYSTPDVDFSCGRVGWGMKRGWSPAVAFFKTNFTVPKTNTYSQAQRRLASLKTSQNHRGRACYLTVKHSPALFMSY